MLLAPWTARLPERTIDPGIPQDPKVRTSRVMAIQRTTFFIGRKDDALHRPVKHRGGFLFAAGFEPHRS